MGLFNGPHTQ